MKNESNTKVLAEHMLKYYRTLEWMAAASRLASYLQSLCSFNGNPSQPGTDAAHIGIHREVLALQ